ncbi:LLM class F420-dependent oxidoreductase [Streptomyces sp. NPDC004647]|uniref:LLM class F420-dependent oxidoreductase n=1 Tax=Streptomyces sp. NPDC004647 TaxID=3154671 RepID=UPI0033AD1584
MDISVVVAAREDDRPPHEPLRVAALADRLGYGELWVGEGPTWDAFVLTTAIGPATERIAMTAGPVPVHVRDPATIARGASSAAALTGRSVGVALGTSSTRVVEGVHGRSRARAATTLAESAEAVRMLIRSERAAPDGEVVPGSGFRRRLAPPGGQLTVAAFGDRAIAAAAQHADRMLLDLVSPEQVGLLRAKLDAASAQVGRTPPRLAAWLPTAVDPAPESITQIMRSIVGYLTVRGYSDMFTTAGFGEAVEMAGAGAAPEELLTALPPQAASEVGLVGDTATVRARLEVYAAAGLDEVAIVPATSGDPGGERTLAALAPRP